MKSKQISTFLFFVLLAAFAVTLLATVLQTQWRDLKQIISETMARAIDPALVEEEAVRATARA